MCNGAILDDNLLGDLLRDCCILCDCLLNYHGGNNILLNGLLNNYKWWLVVVVSIVVAVVVVAIVVVVDIVDISCSLLLHGALSCNYTSAVAT